MAQTTGGFSWANCVVSLSANGSAWTDVSGFTNSVKVSGGERAVSEFFTVDGDTPILTRGKRSALEITLAAVYTELGTDPYAMATTAYEGGSLLYIKWVPKVGGFTFTSGGGYCTKPLYPSGAADSSDALPVEVTIKVATVTKT